MSGVSIQGIEEAIKAIKSLETKVAKKVLRKAMRKGCKPIQRQAQANAPIGESRTVHRNMGKKGEKKRVSTEHEAGNLKRSIKIKTPKRSRSKERKDVVGVMVTTNRDDAHYGPFVEYGTKRIKPRHFLEDAAEQTGNQAIEIASSVIKSEIEALRA